MKRIEHHLVGIDQGDVAVFAEFEEGGAMWTGTGPRERRRTVRFSDRFLSEPSVQVSVSLWDVDSGSAVRAEITAEAITRDDFEIVFRTWSDTRVARIRASWTAIGEVSHPDQWDVE